MLCQRSAADAMLEDLGLVIASNLRVQMEGSLESLEGVLGFVASMTAIRSFHIRNGNCPSRTLP